MEPSTEAELIIRRNVGDLSLEEIEAMLLRIRERRMQAHRMYEEAQVVIKQQRDDKLREKLEQQSNILSRELTRIEKLQNKIDDRIVKLCAMSLELTGEPIKGWQRYFGSKDDQGKRSGSDSEEG